MDPKPRFSSGDAPPVIVEQEQTKGTGYISEKARDYIERFVEDNEQFDSWDDFVASFDSVIALEKENADTLQSILYGPLQSVYRKWYDEGKKAFFETHRKKIYARIEEACGVMGIFFEDTDMEPSNVVEAHELLKRVRELRDEEKMTLAYLLMKNDEDNFVLQEMPDEFINEARQSLDIKIDQILSMYTGESLANISEEEATKIIDAVNVLLKEFDNGLSHRLYEMTSHLGVIHL